MIDISIKSSGDPADQHGKNKVHKDGETTQQDD
jgi:hypothetical protein